MLALNDIHVGVQRQAGTTPNSQEALRSYLFTGFRGTVASATDDHLIIVGDLFDQFEVPPRDWIETFFILFDWCAKGKTLTLVAGNHDWSPKAFRMSSFETLARTLERSFPHGVKNIMIDEWAHIEGGIALAHCSNQDIFELKLDEVLKAVKPGDFVFVHANFDNNFAVHSDHSLNVSRDRGYQFKDAGATLVFAHEHQARTELGGAVFVMGNQWPTSIADCKGNDYKYAHRFVKGQDIEKIMTWAAGNDLCEGSWAAGVRGFGEVSWRDLGDVDPDGAMFVRVIGDASSNEASEVINAIAKYRQKSSAFVVTNATKIDGVAHVEELPETFEATAKFEVVDFIRKSVTPEQFEVIQTKLLPEAA